MRRRYRGAGVRDQISGNRGQGIGGRKDRLNPLQNGYKMMK